MHGYYSIAGMLGDRAAWGKLLPVFPSFPGASAGYVQVLW